MPSLRSRPKYPKCCTTPPQPLHYAYFYRKRSPQMLALPQSLSSYMVSGHRSCRFQSEVIFVKRHGEINTRGQFLLSWLEWEEGNTTKNTKMQKTVTHSWVPLSQCKCHGEKTLLQPFKYLLFPCTPDLLIGLCAQTRFSLHLQCLVLHRLPRKIIILPSRFQLRISPPLYCLS